MNAKFGLPNALRWAFACWVLVWISGCGQAAALRRHSGSWANPPPPPVRWVALPGDDVPRPACPDAESRALPSNTDAPAPLQLGEALDRALCRNPQLHGAWARIQGQEAQLGVARSVFYPVVELGGREIQERTRVDSAVTFPDRDQQTSSRFASVTWRLLDLGARGAQHAAARWALEGALASHDVALQQVLLSVTAAYSDVQLAQARRQAAEQALQLARQSLATVQRRVGRGAAAQSDAVQAAAAVARAALKSSRSDAAQSRAEVALRHAMGEGPGQPPARAAEVVQSLAFELPSIKSPAFKLSGVQPVMPLAERPRADAAGALEEWLELAQSHPALRAAEDEWQVAKAKLDAAWAEDGPALDFRQTRQFNNHSSAMQSSRSNASAISLTLTIPVFSGFSSRYQLQSAQAQLALKLAEWDETRLSIHRQVGLASADALHALRTWQAADHWVVAAFAALESAQRRYAAGAADILELLSAQSAHSEAAEERFRSQSEWHTARLQLLASAGVLNRSTILRDAALGAPPT